MTGLKRTIGAFVTAASLVLHDDIAKIVVPAFTHLAVATIAGAFAAILLWCQSPANPPKDGQK